MTEQPQPLPPSAGLRFAVESVSACGYDCSKLFADHWAEVGQDRVRMIPNPNVEFYLHLELEGKLQVVTARREAVLVGYHVAILFPHPHYKHVLCAKGDLYYLMPAERRGRTGLRLFQFAHQQLQARGVQLVYEITKLGEELDHSKLLEFLGMRFMEKAYSKWIGTDTTSGGDC